jgi:pantetheine-phosphate adenylyltransferase
MRGRRLKAPRGRQTRPTKDRVKEALFNILAGAVAGSKVLDLYAGSGALGIEALSRGAQEVVFVENDRRACRAVKENLANCGVKATLLCCDVNVALRKLAAAGRRFEIILLDPPYGTDPEVLERLTRAELLAPAGLVVLEHGRRDALPEQVPGLVLLKKRDYGDTTLSIYQGTLLSRGGNNMPVALCPGSFDPVTCGHVDIISRAAKIFDHVIVTVFPNTDKNPLFTLPERVEMLREATSHLPNVSVDSFEGLLSDYARHKNAKIVIKGLRAVSDFEYEMQMALMNKKLSPDLETLFMMTSNEYSYLSSSIVKQLARFGGCIDGLVPQGTQGKIMARVAERYGSPSCHEEG